MECRPPSGYCHCASYIIDNNDDNEKTNVYGRRDDDDVCLTYSSHQTRCFCQQKKKKKLAQSYENKKDIDDRQLIIFSTSITVMDNSLALSFVHLIRNYNLRHYVI